MDLTYTFTNCANIFTITDSIHTVGRVYRKHGNRVSAVLD